MKIVLPYPLDEVESVLNDISEENVIVDEDTLKARYGISTSYTFI